MPFALHVSLRLADMEDFVLACVSGLVVFSVSLLDIAYDIWFRYGVIDETAPVQSE